MAFAAGQHLTASLLNSTFTEEKDDVQNTSGTTTTTGSFPETLTGGTACGVTFVVPASGKFEVVNTCEISNSGAGYSVCTYVIRSGGTIGSGTVLLAAAFEHAIVNVGTSSNRKSAVQSWSATPGATINIRQAFRVASGTGTFSRKFLSVKGLI